MADQQHVGLIARHRKACFEFATCEPKDHERAGKELIAAAEALDAALTRVEPVVGPLSGARSDGPSMPPPAASLPVSAPAGVRMLTQEEVAECASIYFESNVDCNLVIAKFLEVNAGKTIPATTEPKP